MGIRIIFIFQCHLDRVQLVESAWSTSGVFFERLT